ncbi:MAG: SiaB family protein kinase [Pseudodesulfovibrio sp.]
MTTFQSSALNFEGDCMLATDMYQFRNYLRQTGIIFCYSGYMTEDILVGIGKAIKKKLSMDEQDSKTAKAVFSIFVEQVQNVIRYSAEKETKDDKTELRYGILTVGREEDKVFVTCGNIIKNLDRDRLKEHLEAIQKMDKAELKKAWKDTLRGETPVGSKGAGVGFLDIARRAGQGFDFDFSEVDETFSFFTLKAYI